MKFQGEANALRKQKKAGAFNRLHEYQYPQILEEFTHSFYKFSGELGTLNLAHSNSIVNGADDNLFQSNFLEKHNFNEHLIVLSIEELCKNSSYIQFLIDQPEFLQFIDPRVIMLNQVMYTFNKEGLYMIENKTSEVWYWG
jgi:hypothetical protein